MTASWCSARAGPSCATSHRCCPRSAKRPSSRPPSATSPPRQRCGSRSPMEVRRIKGDARMGELLRRALEGRRQPLEEDVSLRVRFAGRPWAANGSTTSWPPSSPGPLPTSPAASPCDPAWSARPGARSAPRVGSVPTKPGSRASSRRRRSSRRSSTRSGPRSPPPPWSATCSRRGASWSGTPPGCSPRSEWPLAAPGPGDHGRVHRMEHRRPRPARRGGVPHRRPQPRLRAHRRGRGPGSDADAVPHDRPTRAVGVDHRAR